MKSKQTEMISQREFAKREGVSHTTVAKWVKAGMPTGANGQINPAIARNWIAKNVARNGTSASQSLTDQRARKEAALAGLREIELKRQSGELVNAAEVQALWTDIAVKVRDSLLALPARLGEIVPAEVRRQVFDAAMKEVRSTLTMLSDEIRAELGTKTRKASK